MLPKAIVLLCLFKVIAGDYYNSYSGQPATEEDLEYYEKAGNLMNCTNNVAMPCDPNEGRRTDGTCNNLNEPTRGGFHTPMKRLLPPAYSTGDSDRLSQSGNKLVPVRTASTHLLLSGKSNSPKVTQLCVHTMINFFIDIGSNHDSFTFMKEKPYCCEEEGKSDYMCTPTEIPADDPVFRFTNHRCMNLTRPKSFQTFGCIQNDDEVFSRMEFATATMDLSHVYQAIEPAIVPAQEIRALTGGLLKVDIEDGTTWPPHEGPNKDKCLLNQASLGETRCFGMAGASVPPANFFIVWYTREHNNIASKLALLNPCWDDDKIFETAREINIAKYMEMIIEELMPAVVGTEFMAQSILRRPDGALFSDHYDENMTPHVTLDFQGMFRYMHLLQPGPMKLYDENNYFVKQEDFVNHTLRPGFLCKDNNLAKIARGSILDVASGSDRVAHPDLLTRALGDIQKVFDLNAADLRKTRFFGLEGIAKYIEYFTNVSVTEWQDLAGYVNKEGIELLQEIYEDVRDVDVLAALWVSPPIKGGVIPLIFAYTLEDQLIRFMKADRHWYQRQNRPKAFTESQMQAIKTSSIAELMCEVADISSIQRHAFFKISPENPLLSCDEIPRMDLSPWKDASCECSEE